MRDMDSENTTTVYRGYVVDSSGVYGSASVFDPAKGFLAKNQDVEFDPAKYNADARYMTIEHLSWDHAFSSPLISCSTSKQVAGDRAARNTQWWRDNRKQEVEAYVAEIRYPASCNFVHPVHTPAGWPEKKTTSADPEHDLTKLLDVDIEDRKINPGVTELVFVKRIPLEFIVSVERCDVEGEKNSFGGISYVATTMRPYWSPSTAELAVVVSVDAEETDEEGVDALLRGIEKITLKDNGDSTSFSGEEEEFADHNDEVASRSVPSDSILNNEHEVSVGANTPSDEVLSPPETPTVGKTKNEEDRELRDDQLVEVMKKLWLKHQNDDSTGGERQHSDSEDNGRASARQI